MDERQSMMLNSDEILFLNKMTPFLGGKWQKEQPQKEGLFIVADHRGNILSSPILIYQDPSSKEFVSVHSWGALWWSEPIPLHYGLPPVPEYMKF